jgi:methylenetetrahydrofolate reductase (NADPH)
MPKDLIKTTLDQAKAAGIQNILALRGDPPKGTEKWEASEDGFKYAIDLVKFIREEYGDYFGIAVAGYPEKHPEATDYKEDLHYLKAKIDAGADFVITQLFYNPDCFLRFVDDCRKIGMTCPIIPGIMPISSYKGFMNMTKFCKVSIPTHVTSTLAEIKDVGF